MERVLIVGNGYAGLAAARTLASKKGLAVTLTSAEKCPAYVPHLLPELAAGKKEAADLSLASPEEYREMGIDFRPGAQVEKLSPVKMAATLSTGETLNFDKALIASGAAPYVPGDLQGTLDRCGNVLVMKRLLDALMLRKFLIRGASRIVIVGAGRVGMLLAEALKDREVSIAVVEIGPEILATMLQADVAALLHPVLTERSHLRIYTNSRVDGVAEKDGFAREVRLSDGTILPCDVLVIATGVAPDTGFMENGREDVEGLPVNRRMETHFPGIYAAGDVVRFETITGKDEVGQLALNARVQGETAAGNMAGEKIFCPPSFIGNVVKLDPILAARIGDIDGTDQADFRQGRSFARATFSGRTLTGLQIIGDPEDVRGLVPAVLKKFSRDDAGDLLKGRLDMGLAPFIAARSYSWA
jgi:NADPH-dependent 2,4-dienoyl-CoA reductase/sulfur reductase-like enzyme